MELLEVRSTRTQGKGRPTMNRTKLKTLAVTGFLAVSMGLGSLAATPAPAAFAMPMDCAGAARIATRYYRSADQEFASGNIAGGLRYIARADALLAAYC